MSVPKSGRTKDERTRSGQLAEGNSSRVGMNSPVFSHMGHGFSVLFIYWFSAGERNGYLIQFIGKKHSFYAELLTAPRCFSICFVGRRYNTFTKRHTPVPSCRLCWLTHFYTDINSALLLPLLPARSGATYLPWTGRVPWALYLKLRATVRSGVRTCCHWFIVCTQAQQLKCMSALDYLHCFTVWKTCHSLANLTLINSFVMRTVVDWRASVKL